MYAVWCTFLDIGCSKTELCTGHAGPSSLLCLTICVLKEEIHKQASVDSKHLFISHLAFLLMDVNCAVGKSFVFLERSV